MSQDWQNSYFFILFGAATLHAVYLSLLVFIRSRAIKGHAWLGLTLLGVASLLVNYFIFISGAIGKFPHLLNAFIPLCYLIGPSLYLFIRKSSDSSYKLRWWHGLHTLPILWSVWESAKVWLWTATQKNVVIEAILGGGAPTVVEMLLGNRLNFIMAAYALASLIFLNKLSRAKEGHRWLRKFVKVFLSLVLLSIILPLFMLLLSANGAYFELILTLAYALALHVLGFTVLSHRFSVPWALANGKYQNSPVDEPRLTQYIEQVEKYLTLQQPWLKPQFSITDLSNALNIPKHHLSQVLNVGMKTSFVDLINAYRVAAVKEKLAAGALEKYTMMGIASEVGFASKSTFNRAFKKATGLTPSAYLAQLKLVNTA